MSSEERDEAYAAHCESIISAIDTFSVWIERDTKEELVERLKRERELFERRARAGHYIADKSLSGF